MNTKDDKQKLEDMGLHIIPLWELGHVALKSVTVAHRERVDGRAEILVVHALVHNREVGRDERRAMLVFVVGGEVRSCITMRGEALATSIGHALSSFGRVGAYAPAGTR